MFTKEYDVIVAGAGVAGAAAALECARNGLKTALIEKTVMVGGLATSGLVNIYLPLCDGLGHQVLYGIAEEFLHLSIQYGPGVIPPN
ncbi:MAG: FAD-dependent oxidoreductase, partial [Anaerolineae bacterium]|nr:FAD-dependent oxidoreductase [Anaerolineae bacterium]